MTYHPAPPDPRPPTTRTFRQFERANRIRGAFDRREYQKQLMRQRRAKQRGGEIGKSASSDERT